MLYSLKIAWRYLTSNRAQTSLLILGVAVGVYVFVFMSALIGGLAVLLLDRTVGNIAHVTVEEPDRNPVSLFADDSGALVAVLKSSVQRTTLQSADAFAPLIAAVPHVTQVVGQVLGNGFIAKGEAVAPVAVTACCPTKCQALPMCRAASSAAVRTSPSAPSSSVRGWPTRWGCASDRR